VVVWLLVKKEDVMVPPAEVRIKPSLVVAVLPPLITKLLVTLMAVRPSPVMLDEVFI